jgi:hypothetical protein
VPSGVDPSLRCYDSALHMCERAIHRGLGCRLAVLLTFSCFFLAVSARLGPFGWHVQFACCSGNVLADMTS